MGRIVSFVFGVAAYLVFFLTFLYAIGFVTNLVVPKSIDSGVPGARIGSLLLDAVLLLAFAIPHSVMARPGFKRWWTTIIPHAVERSTYVLIASLLLDLMYWQWRPVPDGVWSVQTPSLRVALQAIGFLGWGTVLVSTFLIDHFELFGLRQVWLHLRGRPVEPPPFKTVALYRYCRHPIMLGFLIAFWSTPDMTLGRLLFAIATTGYILIAVRIEEGDLARAHGSQYEEYRKRTSMLIPMPPR